MRQKASSTDWDTLHDPNVNIHAQHITNHIMSLANECILNRITRIGQRNMYSLHFSPVEIESVLKSLKTGKTTGPGGMNKRILRELSKELAVPFCSLFNQSFETGVFPQCWKVAHVCPIYKNGDRSLPSK